MCNDYEQHVAWEAYCKEMQALELGVPTRQGELDLLQVDDVRIGDSGPVMRAAGNGIELAAMTFGFPPQALAADQYSTSDQRGAASTRVTAA